LTCNAQFNFCCMDCFEFCPPRLHEGCRNERLETKLSKNFYCLRLCRLSDFHLHRLLSSAAFRAFRRVPCFSGSDTLFRSLFSSTTFCKFLCRSRFRRTLFSAPLLQREGHPIQVFAAVNNFCKFFCSLRLRRTPFRTAPAFAGRR